VGSLKVGAGGSAGISPPPGTVGIGSLVGGSSAAGGSPNVAGLELSDISFAGAVNDGSGDVGAVDSIEGVKVVAESSDWVGGVSSPREGLVGKSELGSGSGELLSSLAGLSVGVFIG